MITDVLESREVTISLVEYRKLVTDSICLHGILSVVYDGISLSWDKKTIRFSDENINAILRVFDKNNYDLHLEKLKKDEEIKDGSDMQ